METNAARNYAEIGLPCFATLQITFVLLYSTFALVSTDPKRLEPSVRLLYLTPEVFLLCRTERKSSMLRLY
jgi:hypothetical protein